MGSLRTLDRYWINMPPKPDKKLDKPNKGGKAKKKKWSKGKVKEKIQNDILFEEEKYEKLYSDVPKMKLITTAVVSEKLKIGGSLARRAIDELLEKELIRCVSKHSSISIYTRAT